MRGSLTQEYIQEEVKLNYKKQLEKEQSKKFKDDLKILYLQGVIKRINENKLFNI